MTTKTLPSGFRIEIKRDEDSESPREWDNVGTIVLSASTRYNFGDERASIDRLQAISEDPNNICLPVFIYDHSGITINTTGFNCRWDSGQVGIIFCTKGEAVKEWGKKVLTKKVRDQAISYLKSEIKTLDQYLTGDVFGYIISNPEGVEVDSCWGYYGEDHCMSEAIEAAGHFEKEAEEEVGEVMYWNTRDVVTGTRTGIAR